MEATQRGDIVIVGEKARQQFHDARGYGRPLEGNELALDSIEAAHLLLRGDLETIDGRGFERFIEQQPADFAPRFITYNDLRSRGFYLSPTRDEWPPTPRTDIDFVVYPRGCGPNDGEIAYFVRVIGERESIQTQDLGDLVVAIVDEEGEVTYFETRHPTIAGKTEYEPSTASGILLSDRIVVWEPPNDLYHIGFYGQPLGGRSKTRMLQLSLVEAAYLVDTGFLTIDESLETLLERGRAVEGNRFDRRLQVYSSLRTRGVVPKTGFKFGADFRTYSNVESIENLGHSENLVQVLPENSIVSPRELSLNVRLAGGVRKRMVFALTDGSEGIDWLSVERMTP